MSGKRIGDFDLAEEAVSEALVEALTHWPETGAPDRPGAWLLVTARCKAIDRIRRDARYEEKLVLLTQLDQSIVREPDDRLRLIFTCCHPALDEASQVALTLRAVVGLTTGEIARAFVVPESTLAKRLTRAKRKIVNTAIPYRTPEPEELRERLGQVLRVIYLVFNEGHLASSGEEATHWELAKDAEWLATMLTRWLPEEPEPLGLLALIKLHLAKWSSRFDSDGGVVLLRDQNRSLWDTRQIEAATDLIERAASSGRVGPYQIEAAILAVHCEAKSWEQTDWSQLLVLYSMLSKVDPSPIVLLNRAVVVAKLGGPREALAEVERLESELHGYHVFHAVRASLLRELGRDSEARLPIQRHYGERRIERSSR